MTRRIALFLGLYALLGGIASLGGWVLNTAPDNPDVLNRAREMMTRQLTQMVRLIDDLLDVSRVSRGKLELRAGEGGLRASEIEEMPTGPLVSRSAIMLNKSHLHVDT